MTIAQRKKRVEELTKQIDKMLNDCRGEIKIRAGRTIYSTNIRKHSVRIQWLKNALSARYKHQKIIREEEKKQNEHNTELQSNDE